jgi:hypothetical protein
VLAIGLLGFNSSEFGQMGVADLWIWWLGSDQGWHSVGMPAWRAKKCIKKCMERQCLKRLCVKHHAHPNDIGHKMLKLFSKERALYLVDNPTKVGFSWVFLFAGIVSGYIVHAYFGDSNYIIMYVEKLAFIVFALEFFGLRKYIERRIVVGAVSRESWLVYMILPAGYVCVFLATLWMAHMVGAILLHSVN